MSIKILRKSFTCAVAILTTAAAFNFQAPSAAASKPVIEITPMEALQRLQQGNRRHVEGTARHADQDAMRRLETSQGQAPYVTIIGCADSRVAPEVIFDGGLGNLFTIRVAGNIADTGTLASAEYGVKHLGTPLILILGHQNCGAVEAAITGANVGGSIPALLKPIKAAGEKTMHAHPELEGHELLHAAVEHNVLHTMESVLRESPDIFEAVHAGRTALVGGIYSLEDGTVDFLGTHPQQAALLAEIKKAHKAAEHGEHEEHSEDAPDTEDEHGDEHHAAH